MPRSSRVHALPALDARQAGALLARLQATPGVREARVVRGERRAYWAVDSAAFDEQNVLDLIAGR